MKMKEVCTACGLTERAVRFYVQEGLAAPDAQRRGGRTWLDFSPADVERLKAIATLRRAGFTVEELRAMTKDFPQAAPEAAFALRRRLWERLDAYEEEGLEKLAQKTGKRRKKRTKQIKKGSGRTKKRVSRTDPEAGHKIGRAHV